MSGMVSHPVQDSMETRLHTLLVILERLLEISKVSLLMRSRDGAHALHVSKLRVLRRELDREQGSHIFRLHVQKGSREALAK